MAEKMVTPNFPEEIIGEILSRLPVKSLCRFMCVSNHWLSLISSPHFAKTRLNRTPIQRTLFFVVYERLYSINLPPSSSSSSSVSVRNGDFDVPVASRVQFPYPFAGVLDSMIGSCNGLLLFRKSETQSIFIYNPPTRSFRDVPYHILCSGSSLVPDLIGIGHVPSTDDYKVVTFCRSSLENFASVYTLGTHSSKRIKDFPYYADCWDGTSGRLLHGALHWLGAHDKDLKHPCVLLFDLANEKFNHMELPSSDNKCRFFKMGVHKGCLCVLLHRSPEVNEFWVMNEYGVSESWTKLKIGITYRSLMSFNFSVGDETLFLVDRWRFMWESGGGSIREFVIQGFPNGGYVINPELYMENLVWIRRPDEPISC